MQMTGRADVIAKNDGGFVEMGGSGGFEQRWPEVDRYYCLWLFLPEDCW
jgi:hypothetical protein